MADETEAPVTDELASTRDGRDITRGYVSDMQLLLPQDEVLQLRGGSDYELYKRVLQDTQVATVFQQRRRAVVGRPWQVDAAGDGAQDKAAADFIREQLLAVDFDALTDKMLYGVFYGYAVAEALWGRDGRHVVAEEIRVRDRARFAFDGAGRLRLRTTSQPSPGELMPPRKFWVYQTGADHDDEPYGLGLAHWLYWPTFFRRAGWKYWATFLDKFGRPAVMGTYPPSASDTQKRDLLAMTQAVYSDSGIILPEGMALELLEAGRSGTADYAAFAAELNRAIAKVVLGQSMTTESEGGQYKSEVQNEVRLELVQADADLINRSLEQQVVTWLTEWNYPGAAVPRVSRVLDDAEDLNELAERTERLHKVGFRPTLRQVTDTFGGEWEDVGAQGASNGLRPGGPGPQFAEPETAAATQADRLGADAASAEDALIAPIRKLVDEVGSLEELRDRLVEMVERAPADTLADVMGQALTAAELAGRYDILEEAGDA